MEAVLAMEMAGCDEEGMRKARDKPCTARTDEARDEGRAWTAQPGTERCGAQFTSPST